MVEEKLKKSLLTLLIKTPFLILKWSSKTCGYNHWKEWEKLAQNYFSNLRENSPQMPQFIGLEKLAVGVCQTCRSTGRRSYFRPLSHRSIGRSTVARIQRALLSVRSTGRSTRAFPESRALWTVDRPPARSRRARRSTVDRLQNSVDRSVDLWSLKQKIWDLN